MFSKGDSTNYSCELYTTTEVIYDTIFSNRITYLLERYNESLLSLIETTLDENNQVMKQLNLIQKDHHFSMELTDNLIIKNNANE